ncbi:Branchpoint-bridging protein [Pelomyxa schiedti]|nr:Branchpoint-bridging protein [Pelomyxa schiedti]
MTVGLPGGATACGYRVESARGGVHEGAVVASDAGRVAWAHEQRGADLGRGPGANLAGACAGSGANLFRGRVYPIAPGEITKVTVEIIHMLTVRDACASFTFPFDLSPFSKLLRFFHFDVKVDHPLRAPLREVLSHFSVADSGDFLEFSYDSSGSSTPESMLDFTIPNLPKFIMDVEYTLNETFFLCVCTSPPQAIPESRTTSKKIGILWDCSSSRDHISHRSELECLISILQAGPVAADIITFDSCSIHKRSSWQRSDPVQTLMESIETIYYSGATDLSLLAKWCRSNSDHYHIWVMFSDGVDTLSTGDSSAFDFGCLPVFTICDTITASQHNESTLRAISRISGGIYINLAVCQPLKAAEIVQGSRITADVRQKGCTADLSNTSTISELEPFLVCGRVEQFPHSDSSIEVKFVQGGEDIQTNSFSLPLQHEFSREKKIGSIISRQWALLRLEHMRDLNAETSSIVEFCQQYCICGPECSFIVLFTLEQYLSHQVTPHPSQVTMHAEYMRENSIRKKEREISQYRIAQRSLRAAEVLWRNFCMWASGTVEERSIPSQFAHFMETGLGSAEAQVVTTGYQECVTEPQDKSRKKLKVESNDLEKWKIPPCISNWKNRKGYTIPLDKRLALSPPEPEKLALKIPIPDAQFPDYNFIGLLIGPRGKTQKRIESESGAKISIRGKGSIKEGSRARDSAPKSSSDEPLHVLVTGDSQEQLARASDLVKPLLTPMDESTNEWKKCQLRELAECNGTLRDRTWLSPEPELPSEISTNDSRFGEPELIPTTLAQMGTVVRSSLQTILPSRSYTPSHPTYHPSCSIPQTQVDRKRCKNLNGTNFAMQSEIPIRSYMLKLWSGSPMQCMNDFAGEFHLSTLLNQFSELRDGSILLPESEYDRIFTALSKLVEDSPGDPVPVQMLATVCEALGMWEHTAKLWSAVHYLRPEQVQALLHAVVSLLHAESSNFNTNKRAVKMLEELYHIATGDAVCRAQDFGIQLTARLELCRYRFAQIIPPGLIPTPAAVPLDLRICLWTNSESADVELHITEPGGEKCSIWNNHTSSGGRISSGTPAGLGPFEYTLREVHTGEYTVQARVRVAQTRATGTYNNNNKIVAEQERTSFAFIPPGCTATLFLITVE